MIAAVLVAGLALFFQRTKTGRALRAVADDHAAAQSVGIPLNWIWFVVWLVAGLVALVAATVWGTKLGVQFSITFLALKALPVLIIGGFTSVPGAIVGGLDRRRRREARRGLSRPVHRRRHRILVRLCAGAGRAADAAAGPVRRTHHRADLRGRACFIARPASSRPATPPTWRSFRSARIASRSGCCSPFAFVGVPLLDAFQIWPFGGEYLLRAILIPFLILSLAAVGLNILTGYCGQLSLGSGAFMAIGAYSAYKFGTGVHIPLEIFTIDIPPLPVLLVDPARRPDGGHRRHPVRRAEPAHQGSLSRGGDAGRAVLLRLGVHPREVVHQLHRRPAR